MSIKLENLKSMNGFLKSSKLQELKPRRNQEPQQVQIKEIENLTKSCPVNISFKPRWSHSTILLDFESRTTTTS